MTLLTIGCSTWKRLPSCHFQTLHTYLSLLPLHELLHKAILLLYNILYIWLAFKRNHINLNFHDHGVREASSFLLCIIQSFAVEESHFLRKIELLVIACTSKFPIECGCVLNCKTSGVVVVSVSNKREENLIRRNT